MSRQFHAIIPAGGAGTRLWPLSRRSRPKFLLDPLSRGRTLLQEAVDRLAPLATTITIVTGAAHEQEVRRQLPELGERVQGEILVEPSPRDSMAAIGYAAYVIKERFGDSAVVGSFAADHVIEDLEAFAWSVERAIEGAGDDYLTTLGITPTEPSTAFGYIHPDAQELGQGLHPVVGFVEKPDQQVARDYVDQGYLWNAGIFVVKVGILAAHLREQLPTMDRGLTAIAGEHVAAGVGPGEAWQRLTKIAIDYALAEPVAAQGRVAVVRAPESLGWSDVGDFAAVQRLRDVGAESEILRIDAPDSLVLRQQSATGQALIAVLGIPGAVVVQTDDAVLVTDVEHAQAVKTIVDQLGQSGRQALL